MKNHLYLETITSQCTSKAELFLCVHCIYTQGKEKDTLSLPPPLLCTCLHLFAEKYDDISQGCTLSQSSWLHSSLLCGRSHHSLTSFVNIGVCLQFYLSYRNTLAFGCSLSFITFYPDLTSGLQISYQYEELLTRFTSSEPFDILQLCMHIAFISKPLVEWVAYLMPFVS